MRIVLVVALTGSCLVASADVEAYPRDSFCLWERKEVRYFFSDYEDGGVTYRWTAIARAAAVKGFEAWTRIKDANGDPIVSARKVDAPFDANVKAYLVPFKKEERDVGGRASCSLGVSSIQINRIYRSVAGKVEGIAAHEMGHIHGLGHAGRLDNLDEHEGRIEPVMSGCSRDARIPTLDDHAAIQEQHGPRTPLLANPGFEHGDRFWRTKVGQTDVVLDGPVAGAPSGGDYHVRLRRFYGRPDPDHAKLYQSVRIRNHGTFAASAWVKHDVPGEGLAGTVVLGAWWRPIVFDRAPQSPGEEDCFEPARFSKEMLLLRTVEEPGMLAWKEISTPSRSYGGACLSTTTSKCGAQIKVFLRNALRREGDPDATPAVAIDDLSAYG